MVKKKDKDMEDLPHLTKDGEGEKKKAFVDVTSTESDLTGILGAFEVFLRKFKGAAFVCAIVPAAIAYLIALSVSLTPGYLITTSMYQVTNEYHGLLHAFLMAFSLVLSYGTYGLVLILVVPFLNKLMPIKMKNWRGNWYSVQTIPWYYHNALVQLVRYTILDFITPTPLNIMFYRMMGMKIGKGCVINTSNISDPCMIELEDYVTIGGSATIFGHYAQGGFLVLASVKIKRGATVGLKASIMGDVVVGEKVTVKPHTILLPKTRLNKGDPQ
ncbi:MAG: hypothetical protein BM556_10025 [Bacteriovorax sp. MedPE-SWde]|nr:MAG: hypothetical protein BM556_10025 [Bacteriovorax sp. MedPE-SWde]